MADGAFSRPRPPANPYGHVPDGDGGSHGPLVILDHRLLEQHLQEEATEQLEAAKHAQRRRAVSEPSGPHTPSGPRRLARTKSVDEMRIAADASPRADRPMIVELAKNNGPSDFRIHVNRLTKTTKAKEVHRMFVVFGELKYVKILNYEGGGSKGSAFVQFKHEADALTAVAALGAAGRQATSPRVVVARPLATDVPALALEPARPISNRVAPNGVAANGAAYRPPQMRGRSTSDSSTARRMSTPEMAWRKSIPLWFEDVGESPRTCSLVASNSPVFDGMSEPSESPQSSRHTSPQLNPQHPAEARPPLHLPTTLLTPVFLPPSADLSRRNLQRELLAEAQEPQLQILAHEVVKGLPFYFGRVEFYCFCCLGVFLTTAALRLHFGPMSLSWQNVTAEWQQLSVQQLPGAFASGLCVCTALWAAARAVAHYIPFAC